MIEGKGYHLKEYILAFADEKINDVAQILTFTGEEQKEYIKLLETFKTTNSSRSSTKEKGKALEEIVQYILDKSAVFEVYSNVRTSSNEIDILARLNAKGKYFKGQGLLDFHDSFLSECKNYNKKVDVTWVGKFYSLVKYTKNNLGILFSYKGLSGDKWHNAVGLTKKLYLLEEDERYIIDFNYNDFKKLSEGKSFIELITEKIFNLKNDTSIYRFISEHPNQNLFPK
ncbi:acetylglutamate semialdehyde dehydrogenase [Bacillus sp. EB93]|nr:acetylglutamate semialdehyde dehydrogenase [Peribacillus frigoritolerans]